MWFFLDILVNFLVFLPFIMIMHYLILKNAKRKITLCHQAGIYLFSLLLAGMLSVTGITSLSDLLQANSPLIRGDSINLIPFPWSGSDTRGLLLNILLFVPFGLMLPLLWKSFQSGKRTILTGFLFSLFIEISQLFNWRATDIDDLITNTLGTAIGYLLYLAVKQVFPFFSRNWRLKTGYRKVKFLVKYEFLCFLFVILLCNFFIRPFMAPWIYEQILR